MDLLFPVTQALSAIGALFAVAIVAPLALPFARRYGVNLLLMGMMVVHGALGGAFSPISVYGAFVNETMENNGLPSSPATLFLTPLVINVVVAIGIFALLGGRQLFREAGRGLRRRRRRRRAGGPRWPRRCSARPRGCGQVRIHNHGRPRRVACRLRAGHDAARARGPGRRIGGVRGRRRIPVDLDRGRAAAGTHRTHKDAVGKISWSTVLLICGVITYVGVLQAAGTIEYVSDGITASAPRC